MIPLRCYTVVAASAAQTGAIDWFELTTTSAGGIVLLGLDISQSTEAGDAQDEMIRWYVKRASGSFTSGSGGNTSVARKPTRSGDAAATFTAETNNTTQIAVGSGTLDTLLQSCFNVRQGLSPLFWTPETAFTAKASEALAIGMSAAPADSITWEGTAYVAELLP